MIKSLTVINNGRLKLELSNPFVFGINVRNIDGLDPVKSDINISNFSLNDGGIFASSRLSTRNIILTLGIMGSDKYSVQDSRRLLYKYFAVKQKIALEIDTEDSVFYIEGYVESNEVNIFSKDQTSTISILCPYPYFHRYQNDSINESIVFSSSVSNFEFPFYNEVLSKNIIFSEKINNTRKKIEYYGDTKTGCEIHISFNDSVLNPSIFNENYIDRISINTTKMIQSVGTIFEPGDLVIISTFFGRKKAELYRNGNIFNILNCIETETWFNIYPGENYINYAADSNLGNMTITINYPTLYTGI